MSSELIGPLSENNVKNNMANADAIIRFGRYIHCLKEPLSFSNFRLTSENHAPKSSDRKICGMKHIIHITIVFLA